MILGEFHSYLIRKKYMYIILYYIILYYIILYHIILYYIILYYIILNIQLWYTSRENYYISDL